MFHQELKNKRKKKIKSKTYHKIRRKQEVSAVWDDATSWAVVLTWSEVSHTHTGAQGAKGEGATEGSGPEARAGDGRERRAGEGEAKDDAQT